MSQAVELESVSFQRGEISVLHVDDEPGICELVADFLEREDDRISVETASSASDGLDILEETTADCIVSDYDMPRQNGIDFLETVRAEYPELPFILYTGKGSEEIASEAISAGVTDYLQKASGTSQYTVLANRVTNAVEQYRSLKSVEETEQKLSEIAEGTNDVLFMFDGEWSEILFINSAYEDVWGGSITELKENPTSFLQLVHPDDREKARKSMERISNGKRDVIEYRIGSPEDDGVRWIRGDTKPILDNDGNVDRIVGFTSDITDQKQREQELQELKDRYQSFVDYSTDIITVLDNEGEITYESSAVKKVLGYTPESRIGNNVFEYIHPEDREQAEERFRELLNQDPETTERTEVRIKHEDGSYRWFESIGIDQTESKIEGLVIYSRDITERKEREKQLGRERKRLDEFASVVSHDLRSPLNVAQGRIELAQEECRSEHLGAAADGIERSLDLIDDLLALARVGQEIDDLEPVEVSDLVQTCWDTVETAHATIDTTGELTILADRSRLRQLLENLLRNAVEHCGTDVTVWIGPLSNGFYVEDDGSGIPSEAREGVFGPESSESQGGTRFGLSIVKQIVEAHGWSIRIVEGSEGGARFEITGVDFIDE